jgi:hypothetical protein
VTCGAYERNAFVHLIVSFKLDPVQGTLVGLERMDDLLSLHVEHLF